MSISGSKGPPFKYFLNYIQQYVHCEFSISYVFISHLLFSLQQNDTKMSHWRV